MSIQTASVGFFGKLPAYPDFVRQNAGGPLARALDAWFQEGIAHYNMHGGADWKAQFDAALPKNFLFHTGNPGKFLVGVLRPGRDTSGRRYPFSLFASVSPGKNGEHLHVVPEAYSVFLRASRRMLADLDTIAGELRSGKTSGLATTVQQNLFEFGRRYTRYLEIKKIADFWTETIGDSQGPTKYLVMKNLVASLSPLRGKDLRKFEFCLGLPISPQAAAQGFQVAFWLAVCRRLLGTAINSVIAFWDAAEEVDRARLYVFFRPPGPRYLGCLMHPETAGDCIWDLAELGEAKIDEARAKLAPQLAALLDDSELTLGGFLNALGK